MKLLNRCRKENLTKNETCISGSGDNLLSSSILSNSLQCVLSLTELGTELDCSKLSLGWSTRVCTIVNLAYCVTTKFMFEEFSTCSKSSKLMECMCTSYTMWLHHWCFVHNMRKQSNAILGIILKAFWARIWFSIVRRNLSGSVLAGISCASEINIFI